MTEKHLQVLLQVMVYDCTISGDIFARQPKLTKVEEYAFRPQLLISVYIKMYDFELVSRREKEVTSGVSLDGFPLDITEVVP